MVVAGTVDRDVFRARDFERFVFAHNVDGATAASGFPTFRAITVIERIGRARIDREGHRTAMAGSFQLH